MPAGAAEAEYLTDPAIRLLVDFFRAKGQAALDREDREETWYQDWIDYQGHHGLYAGLLSPLALSNRGHQLDLFRLTRFVEVFAYHAPAHAYSLQVSFLGIFPILMCANEPLKREAIARLEAGGLFAFAVSERNHGSDLLAYETALRPSSSGGHVADGAKAYIGNAGAASMISVLARECGAPPEVPNRRSPLVFFALRPADSPGFTDLRKIRTLGIRSANVCEFEIRGHPVADGDIISRQREAWAAIFGTVDFGKFFLGFGAIGICEHAFAEAVVHLRKRTLYGRPAIELSHLSEMLSVAHARLVAMKLYAYRALDYLQISGPDDRRYLLFNPVQKARVGTEGVKVIQTISECVGARGFEADTFIESALREAPMIPALEGSTHINFGQTVLFLKAYFHTPDCSLPPVPNSVALGQLGSDENPYWTAVRDRTPRGIRFAHPLNAYEPLRAIPNVALFIRQVEAFARFAGGGTTETDLARLTALGKCFSIIVQGQLVAENCVAAGATSSLVAVIYHALISDLTAEALALASLHPTSGPERALLMEIAAVPETGAEDFAATSKWIDQRYGQYS